MQSRLLILIVFLTTSFMLVAQNKVRITVLDSISKKPIENAAVYIKNTSLGTLTDMTGKATFDYNQRDKDSVEIKMIGYKTVSFPVATNSEMIIHISPTGISLEEIIVKKRKEHYSKRNNPTVDLIRKIRENTSKYSPQRHECFSYNQYEKFTISLYDFGTTVSERAKEKIRFMNEFLDTIQDDSAKILVISVKENVSHIHKKSKTIHENVIAQRNEGIDDFLDQTSIYTMLSETIKEIDPYDGSINILNSRFVGPLSAIGPDFYKYYITDTIKNGIDIDIELSFVPRVSSTHGFTGKFLVATGDSTYFIKSVKMGLSRDANINFIDKLNITQDFILDSTFTSIKSHETLDLVLTLIPGTQSLMIRKYLKPYNFEVYDNPSGCDERSPRLNFDLTTDLEWAKLRKRPLTKGESNISLMMESYRRKPILYWSEQIVQALVNGYIPIDKKRNKFGFGPLNTLVSANSVEGLRLRVGGMTTAMLSKNWFGRGYIAYGCKDKKLKYRGEIEYSFNEKKDHSREFPVNSLRASHMYDVDMLGQHYLFTNSDNVFLSWKRMKNILMTYHRVSEFTYTREYQNNISFAVSLKHEIQEATRYLPFITPSGKVFDTYSEASINAEVRFAPGEKFYQLKSERIPINKDAPIFVLRHTFGPGNHLGNSFTINRTEASIENRFWFSAFGHLDVLLKGGHIWSSVPYPSLCLPNANLSYTIQPESFALMNPMEFISDTYVSWFITYNADGSLLNYIPLFNKLHFREIIACRGFFGSLQKKNNPEYNSNLFTFPEAVCCTDMRQKPYIEASIGIDNIFKCIRIDYVWRVTYKRVTHVDRNGVRIAFHTSF